MSPNTEYGKKSIRRRRKESPRSSRENLISAATRVIRAQGFGRFAIRDISDELGISHTAVYDHFGSKDELITAVLDTYLTRLLREARMAGHGAPNGIRRLLAILSFWLRERVLTVDSCLILRGAAQCAYREDSEVRSAMTNAVNTWRNFLGEQLRDAKARGEIHEGLESNHILFAIFGFALGIYCEYHFLGGQAEIYASTFQQAMTRLGINLPAGAGLCFQ
jgi:AcrR family transcriptional regulator